MGHTVLSIFAKHPSMLRRSVEAEWGVADSAKTALSGMTCSVAVSKPEAAGAIGSIAVEFGCLMAPHCQILGSASCNFRFAICLGS
jgi:hypothetical protein